LIGSSDDVSLLVRTLNPVQKLKYKSSLQYAIFSGCRIVFANRLIIKSQSPSDHSVPTVDTHPHLLGPEDAERPYALPTSYDAASVERSLPPIPAGPPSPLPSGQLPPGFIPLSVTPLVPAPSQLRSTSTPRPQYEMAPIPPGVIYPDPPVRPATASSLQKTISTPKSVRRRRDSLGSTQSPAPLDRPISLFSN
jgi:hypothetical protein